MKEKLNSKEELHTISKNYRSYKKPLALFISSMFLISLYIYFYLNISTKSTTNLKSLSEAQSPPNKVKIVPYVSPNRVEGILDNLFYPYHSDIIRSVDEYEFLRDSLGKVELRMILNSNVHGDFAKDFHERANYKHLLILIETIEGNRFGGYTSDNFVPMSVGLISTSIDIQKYDNVAFLL